MKIYYHYPTGLVEVEFLPMRDDGEPFTLYGKPIIGGVFGFAQYVLLADIYTKHRLPAIRYLVCERNSGMRLTGVHDTARDALAQARWMITNAPPGLIFKYCAEEATRKAAFHLARTERLAKEAEERSQAHLVRVKPINKKRLQVFEGSSGKCHYCKVVLTADESWHVEHKLPRSKGGTDLPSNLVASCPQCNRKKGRKTADEFMLKK